MRNIILLQLIIAIFLGSSIKAQNTFYVSPSPVGNDANPGTASSPFATIQRAIDAVKNINKSSAGSTVVTINSGTYQLTNPLIIDELAGGNTNHPVTIKAASGANVLISGGVAVTGWTPTSGKPYFQKTLTLAEVRDLYVGGERRTRARTNERISGLNWVKSGTEKVGVLIDKSKLPVISTPEQLEINILSDWRNAICPVQSMTLSNGNWDVRSSVLIDAYNLSVHARPTFAWPFYIENAIELLDQPGEWCFVRSSQTLYYYPKSGEDMASLEVVVPITEKLLDITGSSLSNKVTNVRFEGLRFAHSAWNAVSNNGRYGHQSEALTKPVGIKLVPGSVVINNASGVVFSNCQIRNTAAVGISMLNGVFGSRIEGCYFYDTGDAAILVSTPDHNQINVWGEEVCTNDTIKNNLIVRAGSVYYDSPAISAFYTNGLVIDHNTIMQVPYTGISIGWGWDTPSNTCKNNRITNNKIVEYLTVARDGGGIYTLGNQPNTIISGNYIKNGYEDYAGLYTDQGSTGITLSTNVVENALRWYHKNTPLSIGFSSNWATTLAYTTKGDMTGYLAPTLVDGGNWPSAAQTVINNSGFSASFTELTTLLPSTSNNAPTVTIKGNLTVNVSLIDQLKLSATVSDDGKPFGLLKTIWRKKSGPGTVTFLSGSEISTLAFFSVPGTYTLECMAKDFQDSTSAIIQVDVSNISLGTNLALNKTANASTNWDASLIPPKGVDGNVNSIWSPAASEYSTFPWWSIDLGSSVSVGRIELEGRRGINQSSSRKFFIVEGSNNSDFSSSTIIAHQGIEPFPYEGTWTFNIVPAVSYRYLRISKSVGGLLIVPEFRVYSVNGTNINTSTTDKIKDSSLKASIFPNPLREKNLSVLIEGYEKSRQVFLSATDIMGRTVFQQLVTLDSKTSSVLAISRSVFTKGIYIIKVGNDLDTYKIAKLIVE